MCHHRGRDRPWMETESTAEEEEAADELPSFLNEESATDTELLTDGGDGDDEPT